MTKISPATASNRYYLARIKAAEFNERLSSREGASQETGIDCKRMQHSEMGIIHPYPEEVVLMAECYNAPELMNWYCSGECPIGKRMIPHAELNHLDRLTIKIMNALDGVQGISKEMMVIVNDGDVTPEDIAKLRKILTALMNVAKVTTEMQIWMEKYAKGGDYHGDSFRTD